MACRRFVAKLSSEPMIAFWILDISFSDILIEMHTCLENGFHFVSASILLDRVGHKYALMAPDRTRKVRLAYYNVIYFTTNFRVCYNFIIRWSVENVSPANKWKLL